MLTVLGWLAAVWLLASAIAVPVLVVSMERGRKLAVARTVRAERRGRRDGPQRIRKGVHRCP